MDKSEQELKELKSYAYELQYYNEKLKDMEKLTKVINELKSKLSDMKIKGYDTTLTVIELNNLEDKQVLLSKTLSNILNKNQKVESKIEDMFQPYKNILFLKYVKNLSFDEIATKMNYSSKRIYQLHKIAVSMYLERKDD